MGRAAPPELVAAACCSSSWWSARCSTRCRSRSTSPASRPTGRRINDQGAILMSTVAPPPSDLALRMAMFNSWGVPTAKGLAGTVMNTLTFYIVRFAAPAVGLRAPGGHRAASRARGGSSCSASRSRSRSWSACCSSYAASGWRVASGTTAARLARRVRQDVDPEAWAQACLGFRARHRRPLPARLPALAARAGRDARRRPRDAGAVPALRGCRSARRSACSTIGIAYLFAYPFTLFPFSGIGVVDALCWPRSSRPAARDRGGRGRGAGRLAGLHRRRAGPLGVGALAIWRRTLPREPVEDLVED